MHKTDNQTIEPVHSIARRITVYTLVALQALPLPTWAATTLVADPAAAVKPVLNVSNNGVPIVQIVPPNAAGVSHNKFTHYNVGAEGQILNNSGLASPSVLAGSVGGNPMLGNSNARLILNEVTSAHPSALNGLVEITGKRADLVIANPNGISVDGAGFVNAGRATLTTGRPLVWGDAPLFGHLVQQGEIRIQGTGLDARGADQLQLLSRSLVVNAKLQANWLDIATGANLITATTGEITPVTGTGTVPVIAVDVGRLGSMYANSMYLVGTETGVGVNVKGKLEALTGDIQLSSAGDLNIVDGGAKAAWDVRLDAARDIRIQGSDIQAGGDAEIVAGRNLDIVATENSTGGSSVSGNTTTTTASTKWAGSVVEAGGDVTLLANNSKLYTPNAAAYAAWQASKLSTEQELQNRATLLINQKAMSDSASIEIAKSALAAMEKLLGILIPDGECGGCRYSNYRHHNDAFSWEDLNKLTHVLGDLGFAGSYYGYYGYYGDVPPLSYSHGDGGPGDEYITANQFGYQELQRRYQAEKTRLLPYQAQIDSYKASVLAQTATQNRLDSLLAQEATFKGGKLTLSASAIRAEGNALLAASNVAVESKVDSQLVRSVYYKKKKKWYGSSSSTTIINQSLEETLVGGAVSAAGDNTILALGNRDSVGGLIADTGNLLLLGSSISSDLGTVQLTAVNDLEVEAAQTRHSNTSETYVKKSGILSTTKTTAIDRSQNLIAEGSLVTGDTVQLQSGRDLMVRGGIVSADNDISLVAGRDLDIVEARDFESRDTIRIKKKSGLFGSGLFGITLGSTSTTQITEEDLDTASASQIASIAGGVSILGGSNVLIQGADLLAGTDIDIVGNNVGILAARNIYDRRDIYKTKTSGLTLALKGGVISALEAAWQASQRAHGAQDDRLAGAYALKAGYHFYDAYTKDAGQAFTDLLQGNVLNNSSDIFLATNGIGLELSLGTSSAQSVNTLHDVTYRASNLDASGDLTVIARQGESSGVLDIMGSNLAGYNQTLSAGKNLSVRYAPQTTVSSEKSNNRSASIGVGIGTQGLYVTAALQVGKATGEALKEDNAESRLIADNTLTLLSGGDASLKGAIAQANRIEADITGNLTLSSLQDSERYKYKSSNAGGSVTVGISVPSSSGASLTASQQTLNNQFQSVVEQTGLFAGEGGFDIKVGGHTQLNGAVIASAAPADKNTLVTNTLDFTDLTNFEQTKTGGYTFGLSTAPGGTFVTPVPNLSVNRQSITQSLIAPGTVEVKGQQAQITAVVVNYLNQYQQVQTLKTQLAVLEPQKQAAEHTYIPQAEDSLAGLAVWAATIRANHPAFYQQLYNNYVALLPADQRAVLTQHASLTAQLAVAEPLVQQKLDTLTKLSTQVSTLQSRTLASANPALTNSFNKEKTRAQLEAMSVFSETAMRIVGDVYARYDKAVSDAERKLLQARAGGNPTAITQADAELKTAQTAKAGIETERALAHGLVGALTAGIGGTSPVSGFIGGTAGKLATTELDKLLADSTWAQTNPTAANLLKTLTATTVGSITGGATGGFVASQGDRFNRQLHPTEINLIKANAARYAAIRKITVDQAEKELAQQAFRQVQFGAAGIWDNNAEAFLRQLVQESGNALLPVSASCPACGPGNLFFANPQQKADASMYAFEIATNASALTFYGKNQIQQPSQRQIEKAVKKDAANRNWLTKLTLLGAAAPVAIVAPTALSWCLTNPVACNQLAITGGEIIAGDALGTVGLGVAGLAGVKAVQSAAKANAAVLAKNSEHLPPWQSGTPVFDVLLQPRTKVQMVVDQATADAIRSGKSYNLGGWATFDDIKSTAADMRQRLAINDKFKPPENGPFFVIELEIKKPVQTNIGFVGSQSNLNGTWLRGGGTQAEFYSLTPAQRKEYLQVVGQPKPLVR